MKDERPAGTVAVARPSAYVWVGVAAATMLLLYGAFERGGMLDSSWERTLWVAIFTVAIGFLLVPALWVRLVLTEDGTLTRRLVRTSSVDLADLVAIDTRGDYPWSTNPSGVLIFEDARGRRVEVELTMGMWLPGRPLFPALAAHIERSGLPLSGIVTRQLEERLHRTLDVADANRRALREARAATRRGRFTPHRASGGWLDAGQTLLAAGLPMLLVWAAGAGMVPTDQVALWRTIFTAVALLLIASAAFQRWRVLELDSDGQLVVRTLVRRCRIDLKQLSEVTLDPDEPYLEQTLNGRALTGRRTPTLVLRDAADDRLRIKLGSQWQGTVPILRHVLAAVEERGVALSPHARYELEFRVGLIEGPEWIGGNAGPSTR